MPPVAYAGFWRRLGALLLDLLITTVLGLPFLLLPGAGWITGLLVWWLYFPFFNSSALQGTPGKIYLGLAVTDEAGSRLRFRSAAIRELLEIVSGLLLGLGYLLNLFTPRRQTFHDLLAGTLVVRRPVPELIDLWGAWRDEFQRVFRLRVAEPTPGGPPAPSPVAPEPRAVLADLETLHRLHLSGALTEEEYQRKKAELLARV